MACLLLQLRYHAGEKTVVATASARLCYGCCTSQGRINVSTVPTAPRAFFQPLSSCLAYPGFSERRGQCEQHDNWHHERDQQDTHPRTSLFLAHSSTHLDTVTCSGLCTA